MKLLSFLFLTLLISSCSYTSSKPITPEIKNEKTLSAEIGELVTADDYNVSGEELNQNGMVSKTVIIAVTNPKDLPKGLMNKSPMAQRIAEVVKNNLSNTSEFNQYEVKFIFTDGSTTESQSLSFTAKDLK